MLDIIIPVYNNYDGLANSLASFGIKNRVPYHFIIIDDASNIDYTPIINFYSQWLDIQYYKLNKNSGPGIARNVGLKYATHKFIMFLDAGDELYNSFSILHALAYFQDNDNLMIISPTHIDTNADGNFLYVWAGNNRIHGKIYKKDFLNKYNITFGEEQSRCNEDIGFNLCCRLICKELEEQLNCQTLLELDEDIILWIQDDINSLTNKGNHEFYFKQQNLGLAINFIHGLNIAIDAGVRKEIYIPEIYDVFVNMWKYYISTANSRPEYINEALTGAYYFYQHCFKKFPFDAQLLLYYQNIELKGIDWMNDPFSSKLFTFSLLDFIKLLEQQGDIE